MLIKIFNKEFWNGQRLLLLTFFVVHFILTLIYLKQQPLTNDEADYIEYAKRWMKGNPLRIKDVDDSKTPVVAIAWLPRMIKQLRNKDLQMSDWGRSDQLDGRYMMIIFFWGVFLYVYLWGKKLYGKKGWIIPLLLLIIDPLFMAFTPIVTSDVACVFVLLAVMYHAYMYSREKSKMHFFLTAFFSGLAMVTKSSMVFIPIILFIIFITRYFYYRQKFTIQTFVKVVVYLFVCWLVINAGFYFYGGFKSWGSIHFQSTAFNSMLNKLSFIKPLPTLLPEPFIQGFDQLQYHKEVGPYQPEMPFKGVFILDKKYPSGIWFYYLVTGFFKLPIAFLVLLFLALFFFIKNFRVKGYTDKYQFLFVPIFIYALVLSFLNPFQQGIRHAMILFPFLFLAIGYVWQYCRQKFIIIKLMIPACITLIIISTATFYPDIMHYTNEFIADKKSVFKYIAEFNYRRDNIEIDCAPFIQKHPDYTLPPGHPAAGKFIIPGAYIYNSTYEINKKYNWLKSFEPNGQYRYVFLTFDIKQQEIDKISKQ